jgi:hydrogenase maturation protein HypF
VDILLAMMEKQINSPLTSSLGRLFDAVAAIIGLRDRVAFEGQAAMELEMILDDTESGSYDFSWEGQVTIRSAFRMPPSFVGWSAI